MRPESLVDGSWRHTCPLVPQARFRRKPKQQDGEIAVLCRVKPGVSVEIYPAIAACGILTWVNQCEYCGSFPRTMSK